jgi:BTB/POZ domain-containing protein 3/6
MSPPHNNNNALLNQRDNLLITQPSSIPNSPLASPIAQSVSPTFCLQSSHSNSHLNQENEDPTTDPNWQANKATVRERNAAMFNNELMADIKFIVGCDGMYIYKVGSKLKTIEIYENFFVIF